MQGRVALWLIIFDLCLGCTSEQWVKEYVQGETSGLQEASNRHLVDAERRQEELIKGQTVLEGQIKELRASLETMDKKLLEWQDITERFKKGVEGHQEVPSPGIAGEGTTSLKLEIEDKFAKLEEMKKDITHLRELQQFEGIATDKELAALNAEVKAAKRLVDMHLTEVLKAQERLKDFIIEEVRALRVERQEHARELEAIKDRLQAIENTMGEKKPPTM